MKKCKNTFALLALFGAFGFAMPALAAPIEAAKDDAPVAATEEDEASWEFGAAFGLDYCSKQLTYGLVDNPHGILTPSVELSYGHDDYFTLAVGAEAIFDTTNYGKKDGGYNDRRYKYQELALGLTLSKVWKTEDVIGSNLETAINYTYEYHPKSCKKPAQEWSNPNTQWLNFEISAGDYWLVPTFALEYNLDDQQDSKGAIYATFDLSHEFDLSEMVGCEEGFMTLTPVVGFGMGNKERNKADFGDWYEEHNSSVDNFMLRDGYASLELAISPFDGFTVAPYIGCHQQLDSNAKDATGSDDFVAYFGIGIGYEI
ncbi:MAG: hypothetical protein Q4F99_06035 [bacterium]|nr:hypothetical protein [bacterium]